jgi:cytochrome c553
MGKTISLFAGEKIAFYQPLSLESGSVSVFATTIRRSRMLNRTLVSLIVAGLVSGSHAAWAQEKAGVEGQHALCIGCHGIPGYKTAFPSVYHVPKIAGQQPGYIVSALKAYKSGARSHPSMRGIAASLTDEQMQKLAEYYGAPAK